jgi:hypothetical protein
MGSPGGDVELRSRRRGRQSFSRPARIEQSDRDFAGRRQIRADVNEAERRYLIVKPKDTPGE